MKKINVLKNTIVSMAFLWVSTSAQITNRIYTIGNSVTDGINFTGFQSIANQRGNTHQFARHMIPGSPLFLIYNSTFNGFKEEPYGYWPNAFENYDWDCISFQPFDRGITGSEGDFTTIEKWINYIKSKRSSTAQLQTYIYSRYPRVPNGKTQFTATKEDWDNLWLGTYGAGGQNEEKKSFFIDLLNTVRGANLLAKPTCITPVGDVMYELNQKMFAGSIPGYNDIWDLYSDGIHMNNVGSFVLGSTFFATMYKQDPRGITVPSAYGSIPDNVRDIILQTVYEVVFNHPFSGTSLNDIIAPTGVSIEPKSNSLSFLQSYVLTSTFSPTNASNKNVTWSSSNTSIASVDKKGKVTGVGSGIATITGITNIGGFTDFAVVTVTGLANFTSVTGVLIGWDYNGKPGSVTGMNATFASNGISTTNGASFSTFGSGLIIRDDSFGNNRLMVTGQTSQDLVASIGDGEYFSFKIKPQDGKLININNFRFRPNSQAGGHVYNLMSSLKGFNPTQVLSTFLGSNNNLIDMSITGHNNISQEIEFRLYITVLPNTDGFYSFVAVGDRSGNDCQIEGAVISPIDNEKPSTVSGITISNIKDASFYLSWNESTDNMIVTGYNVYLNGSKLNSSLLQSTNFNVTSLTSGTICNITVTAVDYVGNESNPSVIQTITNRQPTAILVTNTVRGAAPLTVQANGLSSTDPDGSTGDFILGYDFNFGDGSPIENANSVSHTYSTPGVYTLSLVVVDTRDFRSTAVTQIINVKSDITSPSVPTNLIVSNVTTTSLNISWSPSTDNVSVSGYAISVNGVSIGAPITTTSYNLTGLTAGTNYTISIQAIDAEGNLSLIAEVTTANVLNVKSASNSKSDIYIYPNPVSGDELYFSEVATGVVYDLLGNAILSFKNVKVLAISEFRKGIYFVKLNSGKTIKLIIN